MKPIPPPSYGVWPDILFLKNLVLCFFIIFTHYVLMQVSEAIQSSTRAIQENQISIEEVELCLLELDENMDSLKRLDNALGKVSLPDFCCI